MAVNTQTFSQLVSNTVAAIQGACTQLIDLTVGSVLRSFADAFSLLALWLQGLVLQAAALTRFATSFNSDADSWAADFGFQRLPSQPSSGQVTIARFTATQAATIQAATQTGTDSYGRPIWSGGAIFQTADGSLQFQVIPDTTQAAYNSAQNAYLIAGGTSSITATVQCTTAGSATNVSAGMINTLASAIPYVDTVTNAAPFTNGADAELDPAFKARFVLWINSLSEGTPAAVRAAVLGVAQNVSCAIVENEDYAGDTDLDYFYAVVNDGTGHPSSTFLSTCANAIEAVRPIATGYGVFGTVAETANVALTIAVGSGYVAASVAALVQSALQAYIATLARNSDQTQTLPWSRIGQVAYDASPGVTNVTAVTLNSGTSDLTVTAQQTIVVGTVTVTT